MGEELLGSEEEEEPLEIFKIGGSLEYEEKALERAASRDDLLTSEERFEPEVDCSAKGEG